MAITPLLTPIPYLGIVDPSDLPGILNTLIGQINGSFTSGGGGGGGIGGTVVEFTTTSKTLALSDASTLQDCSNASQQTVTIPLNASVAFPVDTQIQFQQTGAGTLVLTAAGGVTLNGVSGGSVQLGAQYTGFYLIQLATDSWAAIGTTALGTAPFTVSGGVVATNAALAHTFYGTLVASTATTFSNPTNMIDGQNLSYELLQPSGGSGTITWGSAFDFGAAGAPTLTTTQGKYDVVGFQYSLRANKWFYLGGALGY